MIRDSESKCVKPKTDCNIF